MPEAAGIFVQAGVKDKNGCTALDLAVVSGHADAVQAFFERKLAQRHRND